MNQRIYLDLEYCYPNMTKASGRPGDDELRQVIQIAAICYDHVTGEELRALNLITRPPFTKQLPDFFTELTGITQVVVDEQGMPFLEALEQLVKFCGDVKVYTFDKDWYVLRQNCGYYESEFPFETKPFYRVKQNLKTWNIPENKYSSGTLYKAAGLSMSGHVHDALHDVRSMAAAIRHFELH